MSLLPFCALKMVVAWLSMQGQRAVRFHQKYLNLCSEDERRSYGFGTTGRIGTNDDVQRYKCDHHDVLAPLNVYMLCM